MLYKPPELNRRSPSQPHRLVNGLSGRATVYVLYRLHFRTPSTLLHLACLDWFEHNPWYSYIRGPILVSHLFVSFRIFYLSYSKSKYMFQTALTINLLG